MNRREFLELAALSLVAQRFLVDGTARASCADVISPCQAFPDDFYPPGILHNVITVDGPVTRDDMGMVLPHEHLLLWHRNTTNVVYQPCADQDRPPCNTIGPSILNCISLEQQEVQAFANCPTDIPDLQPVTNYGYPFRTIVEVSCRGLRWEQQAENPFPNYADALLTLSRATSAYIVMGTGYYKEEETNWVPPGKPTAVECIETQLVEDIRDGVHANDVDQTLVRAGVIGEIGMSALDAGTANPAVIPHEERVLIGAALAQLKTGTALIIHFQVGPTQNVRQRGISICEAVGVDLKRVVVSHCTAEDYDNNLALLARGVNIAFDRFGQECPGTMTLEQWSYPQDRIGIIRLRQQSPSNLDRILLSHDVYSIRLLKAYGGEGYAHLLQNVIPKWLDASPSDGWGPLTQSEIVKMVKTNPHSLLPIEYQTTAVHNGWLNPDSRKPQLTGFGTSSIAPPPGAPADAQALSFDDQLHSYATAALGDYLPASRPFTVDFWLKADNIPSAGAYVTVLDHSHGIGTFLDFADLAAGWAIQILPPTPDRPAGHVQFAVGTGTQFSFVVSQSALTAGAYSHIAATYTGCELKIYLGDLHVHASTALKWVPLNSAQFVAGRAQLRPFFVGKWSAGEASGQGRYLKGVVAGLRFHARALSDTDVVNL